jgi:DNA polymerase-3 subunit epsilon
LCKRYNVDNSNRELHGALLDAEILADVYLAMTGGQVSLTLMAQESETATDLRAETELAAVERQPLRVLRASEDELAAHQLMLDKVNQASGGQCVWLKTTE